MTPSSYAVVSRVVSVVTGKHPRAQRLHRFLAFVERAAPLPASALGDGSAAVLDVQAGCSRVLVGEDRDGSGDADCRRALEGR